MSFTDCDHLVQKHPDLARVFTRLDSQLAAMGTAEVIRPDELASFLNIERNQMRSLLEMLTLDGVLRQVEMIECRFCQMAAFVSDYKEAVNEEGEYRCTACDRPLTEESIQTLSAYRRGEKWPVSESKDRERLSGTASRNSNAALDESALYTSDVLASAFNVGRHALRKRLERHRKRTIDGWKLNEDRRPREPGYLYRFGAVKTIIEELSASSERPAK